MTIRKGSDYGRAQPLAPGGPIVSTDAELHALMTSVRSDAAGAPTVGLLGGDLCRTLGGTGDSRRLFSPEARTLPIDLGLATIDGNDFVFTSHVVVGALFGTDFIAVMNAQWWGPFDLGPRSHPGDGLLDVTQGSLSWSQRRMARRRARTGSHLPHPQLRTTRVSAAEFTFDRPVPVLIDHSVSIKAVSLSIRVIPDAFSVVI